MFPQQGLGDQAFEFEISAGLVFATFAGVEPLASLPGERGSVFGGGTKLRISLPESAVDSRRLNPRKSCHDRR